MLYEKHYLRYDVVEPKSYLVKKADSNLFGRINSIYKYIEEIPYKRKYSKIISIACLEHIHDLEEHLQQINNHLEDDGCFLVAIPAEGEFLWWLSWRLTTGISFWLRYKLDYGVIMRHEHVNSAKQVVELLRKYFFVEDIDSFPVKIKHLRLYITLKCSSKGME